MEIIPQPQDPKSYGIECFDLMQDVLNMNLNVMGKNPYPNKKKVTINLFSFK